MRKQYTQLPNENLDSERYLSMNIDPSQLPSTSSNHSASGGSASSTVAPAVAPAAAVTPAVAPAAAVAPVVAASSSSSGSELSLEERRIVQNAVQQMSSTESYAASASPAGHQASLQRLQSALSAAPATAIEIEASGLTSAELVLAQGSADFLRTGDIHQLPANAQQRMNQIREAGGFDPIRQPHARCYMLLSFYQMVDQNPVGRAAINMGHMTTRSMLSVCIPTVLRLVVGRSIDVALIAAGVGPGVLMALGLSAMALPAVGQLVNGIRDERNGRATAYSRSTRCVLTAGSLASGIWGAATGTMLNPGLRFAEAILYPLLRDPVQTLLPVNVTPDNSPTPGALVLSGFLYGANQLGVSRGFVSNPQGEWVSVPIPSSSTPVALPFSQSSASSFQGTSAQGTSSNATLVGATSSVTASTSSAGTLSFSQSSASSFQSTSAQGTSSNATLETRSTTLVSTTSFASSTSNPETVTPTSASNSTLEYRHSVSGLFAQGAFNAAGEAVDLATLIYISHYCEHGFNAPQPAIRIGVGDPRNLFSQNTFDTMCARGQFVSGFNQLYDNLLAGSDNPFVSWIANVYYAGNMAAAFSHADWATEGIAWAATTLTYPFWTDPLLSDRRNAEAAAARANAAIDEMEGGGVAGSVQAPNIQARDVVLEIEVEEVLATITPPAQPRSWSPQPGDQYDEL